MIFVVGIAGTKKKHREEVETDRPWKSQQDLYGSLLFSLPINNILYHLPEPQLPLAFFVVYFGSGSWNTAV